VKKTFTVKNLADLNKVAIWLEKEIGAGTLLLLSGSLGTGKTALTKKLLNLFGWPENKVKSPTFSLINRYLTGRYEFYHLDLYRLESHDQFLLEEMKEYMSSPGSVLIIEWPEKLDLKEIYPLGTKIISVNLSFKQINLRNIEVCVNNSENKQYL
jgi:tRNA threonylcarbamoyladenosine biosynthesis protein TsaE